MWAVAGRAEAGGGRQCVRVIEGGGARVGSLVTMADQIWGASGQEVAVFDTRAGARVRALAPAHAGHVTQICKVRQQETRVVWSYSLSDKTLRVWVKECLDDSDARAVIDELAAGAAAAGAAAHARACRARRRRGGGGARARGGGGAPGRAG